MRRYRAHPSIINVHPKRVHSIHRRRTAPKPPHPRVGRVHPKARKRRTNTQENEERTESLKPLSPELSHANIVQHGGHARRVVKRAWLLVSAPPERARNATKVCRQNWYQRNLH